MIPRDRFRPTSSRAIPCLGLALLVLAGCQDRAADGGTTDGTSTVAFYLPDGKPAVNARVQVFASSDTTRTPRAQAFTDAQGRVDLPVLDANLYNLVARDESGRAMFQDSLLSDGRRMDYASDTLVGTGVVTGRVRVQPQHDPRIVWIALLGAGTYLNVDDSGRFRVEGVPEGRFTLGGFTKSEGYTTTFKALKVKRDSVSDIGTLDMVFTGLPVVKNLEARFDTLAGLVHLRWDSIALRQTWKYTVLRDGIVVGETTGPRWIDTVSDEYPAEAPSQGRHAYRVVVSDAERPGPVWETIEMRIISAYLYEEVKVDWVRKAALPWTSGFFTLDTAGGGLVAWRSAEYGASSHLSSAGFSYNMNEDKGLIEQWISEDSGSTWRKVRDSMDLAFPPVRFQGRWWSVRRSDGLVVMDGSNSMRVYDSLVVLSSLDGGDWDSVATLRPDSTLLGPYLQSERSRLWIVGGRNQFFGFIDAEGWSMGTDPSQGFAHDWTEANLRSQAPLRYRGVLMGARYWDGGWWLSEGGAYPKVNGRILPLRRSSHSQDPDLAPRLMRLSEDRFALFLDRYPEDSSIAASFDSSLTVVHALSWPGSGFHREFLWGGRILSISDSGVFLGRILSGLEGGDPRGTWVKKTETPRVF